MKIIPDYHPPADYRRPTKTQEKVYVPVNDYPEINFSEITNPILTFPRAHCHVLKHTYSLNEDYVLPLLVHASSFILLSLFEMTSLTHSLCFSTNSWTSHRSSWQHTQENGN